jgi:hypothetical protein
MKTYSEKLRDPRWQRKRLKILERDNFTCRLCSNDKMELHIHHIEYEENPWESDNLNLITYCKVCHKNIEISKKSDFKIVEALHKYPYIIYDVLAYGYNPGKLIVCYNDSGDTIFDFMFPNAHANIIYKLLKTSLNHE